MSRNVVKTLGASNLCDHERANQDYYATPEKATEWLIKLETFDHNILEPACGEGHISKVLEKHGYNVTSTDLVDRGYGTVADFLDFGSIEEWNGDIITNPPYNQAQEFVEKAIRIIPNGHKVAMFLKLTFLEGKSRKEMFRNTPPDTFMSAHQDWLAERTEGSLAHTVPLPIAGLFG